MKTLWMVSAALLSLAGCCHEVEVREAVEDWPTDGSVSCEEICTVEMPEEHDFIECEFGQNEEGLPATICTWSYESCTYELH